MIHLTGASLDNSLDISSIMNASINLPESARLIVEEWKKRLVEALATPVDLEQNISSLGDNQRVERNRVNNSANKVSEMDLQNLSVEQRSMDKRVSAHEENYQSSNKQNN